MLMKKINKRDSLIQSIHSWKRKKKLTESFREETLSAVDGHE